MWHCKHKGMYIRTSYKNVKTSLSILGHVMFLMQKIQAKIIEKNTAPEEDEFYEYPYYIARIQRRFITTKKRWFKAQYPHHRFIIEELDNANSIHAFNRFEEKGYVERFQCHFRLVDIPRDALLRLPSRNKIVYKKFLWN